VGKKKQKGHTKVTDIEEVEADIQDTVEEEEKLQMMVSSSDLKMEVGTIKIVLSKDIYQKLMYYVMATTDEISGLGMCTWDKEEIRIDELFLLKQENSGSSTELDDEEISKLIVKLVREGKNTAGLRFWFHSHSDMGKYGLTALGMESI